MGAPPGRPDPTGPVGWLGRAGCTVLLVVALLAAGARPASAAAPPPVPATGVQVIAHRGASDRAPELTTAVLDLAVADRADRLSIDVRMTADGVPVVLHDASLRRTTDAESVLPGAASYAVAAFTLDQLSGLDAGSWFGDRSFAGSRLLTLDAVLTELDQAPVGLTVEVKDPDSSGGVDGIGRAVAEVVDRHPAWSTARSDGSPRLVLESYQWDFLDQLHQDVPDLAVMLLGDVTPDDLAAHPYAGEIDVPASRLTDELVRAAHARGVRVGVWTVNGDTELGAAAVSGVDGITTDQPDLLAPALRAIDAAWTGARSPAEPTPTTVSLALPGTVRLGARAPAEVRLRAGSTPVRWTTVSVESLVDGRWVPVADTATDSRGRAWVSDAVTDGLRLRAAASGLVSPPTTPTVQSDPVALPDGAPAPSRRVAAQPRAALAGADARVAPVPRTVWAAMVHRSYRAGCPVGRSGLRLLTASYWGFDGYRHRGQLVVATRAAPRLARVLATLYARRTPVRSLRRPETLGTWGTAAGRALRSGSSFGFACQRVPGDPAGTGSHARGTVVTLNPWENPTAVGSGGNPDSWWLSRLRAGAYVHAAGRAVVRAFAAQGFAWNGRTGRYAEFRLSP